MRIRRIAMVLIILSTLMALEAHAGVTRGSNPWEAPLFIIMESVTGPLGRSITAIAIAVAGFSWLFGGHERGMRTVLGLAIGIALTLGAVQVMDALEFGGRHSLTIEARERLDRPARGIPIHRSLVRPIHYAGCERESIGALLLTCVLIPAWVGLTLPTLTMALVLFLYGLSKLRKLTRDDPDFRIVRLRYYQLAPEYEPSADVDVEPLPTRVAVPLAG